jgi:hypothetical protein
MEAAPEIRDIISAWFEAAAIGDASWRDRHVSRAQGTRIVGTDPEEFLDGAKAYDFLRNEALAVGGKIKVTVGFVEAFKEGSVGWGVALPTIQLPNGDTASPRWSAVFHQEDGDWKLVQLHASIPVTNAESFGDTFPGVGGSTG